MGPSKASGTLRAQPGLPRRRPGGRSYLSPTDERLPRSVRHTPPYSRLPDGCCKVSLLDPCLLVEFCHGAGKGHRGETRVWVQRLVKRFIKQRKGQQAKNRTENRVGHHRRQHSAGVIESREQND